MKRIAAIVVLAFLLLAGCAEEVLTWQGQYDLGIRYLNESNYEEAILAFTQAIEIDPKNVDGYLGRAEAYLGAGGEENRALAVADFLTAADICLEQDDSERAEEILKEAQESVGEDQQITDKLEQLSPDDDAPQQPKHQYQNTYYPDGTLQLEYKYDESGNMIRLNFYNPDGSLGWYGIPEYDVNGNEIREDRYDADGNFIYYYTYDCDENGNTLRQCKYDPNGNLEYYFTNEFNSNNKLVKQSEYDPDGSITFYTIYEYDQNGNRKTSKGYSDNGNLFSVIEYYENGYKAKETYYDVDGSVHYTEYDENGIAIN